MADELLDLVDRDDNVIGTVLRSVAQNNPSKIYRIVSITVFNDLGETLIQKRAGNKSHPGKWENAASGHVLAGEDPNKSATRELSEELGIRTNPIYFDKWLIEKSTKTKFMWLYYVIIPSSTELVIDKNEVEEIRWIKPKDLLQFSKMNKWDIDGYSHKEIMEIAEKLKIK